MFHCWRLAIGLYPFSKANWALRIHKSTCQEHQVLLTPFGVLKTSTASACDPRRGRSAIYLTICWDFHYYCLSHSMVCDLPARTGTSASTQHENASAEMKRKSDYEYAWHTSGEITTSSQPDLFSLILTPDSIPGICISPSKTAV